MTKVRQNYSEQLRDMRQKSVKEASVQNQKTITEALRAKVEKPDTTAAMPKTSPLVGPGRDIPQTVQKARPEVQDKAAQNDQRAGQEFLKARQDALNLRTLQTKVPQTASGDRAATGHAVTQKGQTTEPHFTNQNPQPPLNMNAAIKNAQMGAARQNAAGHLAALHRLPAKDRGQRTHEPKDTRRPDPMPRPAGEPPQGPKLTQKVADVLPFGGKPDAAQGERHGVEGKPRQRDGVERKSDRKGTDSSGHTGGVYAGKSREGKELGALMGGFAGGGENADTDGNFADVSVDPFANTGGVHPSQTVGLPETDPTFHVYSEFDTLRPGFELVMSKARLFTRHVEKRLTEIAEFDRDLGFQIRGLSERVVGELKDLITHADFLKNVYG